MWRGYGVGGGGGAVRVGIVCRRTRKQTAGTCHHVDRQGSQTYRVDCEGKGRRESKEDERTERRNSYFTPG